MCRKKIITFANQLLIANSRQALGQPRSTYKATGFLWTPEAFPGPNLLIRFPQASRLAGSGIRPKNFFYEETGKTIFKNRFYIIYFIINIINKYFYFFLYI